MFRVKPETSPAKDIAEFKSDKYYLPIDIYKEEKSGKVFSSICIQSLGVELVAQYYREKYSADITIFDDLDKFTAFIKSADLSANKRKAFVLISGEDQPHAIPVVLINENQRKSLIWADSLGTTEASAKKMAADMDMSVYYVAESRQLDRVSCYVDALTFARDVTAYDEKLEKYCFSDFLTKIKDRATKVADAKAYTIKLPDELLKTAQISGFVTQHAENSERKIYKSETLSLFRDRYTDQGRFLVFSKNREVKKENLPAYLRKKSLKLAIIIEIQFYINELHKFLGNKWTVDLRKQFVVEAKKVFSVDSNNRYAFVCGFLSEQVMCMQRKLK